MKSQCIATAGVHLKLLASLGTGPKASLLCLSPHSQRLGGEISLSRMRVKSPLRSRSGCFVRLSCGSRCGLAGVVYVLQGLNLTANAWASQGILPAGPALVDTIGAHWELIGTLLGH